MAKYCGLAWKLIGNSLDETKDFQPWSKIRIVERGSCKGKPAVRKINALISSEVMLLAEIQARKLKEIEQ
jgi:hypothetical protein